MQDVSQVDRPVGEDIEDGTDVVQAQQVLFELGGALGGKK